ncbi:MAG: hypothetical protein WKF89_08585 [Chitinophagaceae bacterium]
MQRKVSCLERPDRHKSFIGHCFKDEKIYEIIDASSPPMKHLRQGCACRQELMLPERDAWPCLRPDRHKSFIGHCFEDERIYEIIDASSPPMKHLRQGCACRQEIMLPERNTWRKCSNGLHQE